MESLARDLNFAVRSFLRSPGITAAVIVSLAIGIGANTAVFSIVSAPLLRPLPYRDADRLVILWNTSPGLGITQDWFSRRSMAKPRFPMADIRLSIIGSFGANSFEAIIARTEQPTSK